MEPARGLGRLLDPVVGDGEGGDSTGFSAMSLTREAGYPALDWYQRTLATASARPSVIVTQTPEFVSDWRLR